MKRTMIFGLACVLAASSTGWTRERAAPIAKGTQIGVVNLLDRELMQYHAAREYKDSFVKLRSVSWPIEDMLGEALKEQLGRKGLTFTTVAPSEALLRSREDCFVNAQLAKGLPKSCAPALAQLASSAGVNLLIVMAPGLNNSDHTGTNNNAVSESLRGWGFFTREQAGSKDRPSLFCDTELLLVSITPQGAVLRARQWGGMYALKWQSYSPPADPKELPAEQLDELQPMYAAILAQQAKDLMEQVPVSPEGTEVAER